MNGHFIVIATSTLAGDPFDPQTSWLPWLVILAVVVAVLALAFRMSKGNKRGASAIGASVAGLDAMLRPSRRHVHEAKNSQRKRDEGEGGPDDAGE